jgi:hypothetical protein
MVYRCICITLFCSTCYGSSYTDLWEQTIDDQPDNFFANLDAWETTEIDCLVEKIIKQINNVDIKKLCRLILSAPSSRNGSPRARTIVYAKEQLISGLCNTFDGTKLLKALISGDHNIADLISRSFDN